MVTPTVKVQATGTWVILEDPRPKEKKENIVHLLKETSEYMAEQKLAQRVFHTVLSVGPNCADKRLKTGSVVVVDPRMPGVLVAVNEIEKNSDVDEVVAVVQENQIIMIVG